MESDDNLLPLSGLQHLVFCERQAALIHVEQVWRDNPLTLEGTHLHRQVDDEAPRREVRGDVVILRGITLRSSHLGLIGRADVVELHRDAPSQFAAGSGDLPAATTFDGLTGFWRPFPVDYKRGKPKPDRADEVQLCAQALCLEEMLEVRVSEGALFYGKEHRRHRVSFVPALRAAVASAAARFHQIVAQGLTPAAVRQPKCRGCSLIDVCMPKLSTERGAARYLESATRDALKNPEGSP